MIIQRSNTDALDEPEFNEPASTISQHNNSDPSPSRALHSTTSSFWIGRSNEEIAPQSDYVSHVPSLRQIYGADYNKGKKKKI